MKRWCLIIAGLLVTTTALAQEDQQEQATEKGTRPAVKTAKGGRVVPGRDAFESQVKKLRQALELTDEQNEKLDKLIETMPDRKSKRGEGEGGSDNNEERLALLRDLSDARQSGDEGKTKEIRKKLADLGGGSSSRSRGDKFDRLLHEIEPILNDEQIEKLDKFRADMKRNRRRGVANPEQMFKTAEKLDLDDGQQDRINRLQERFADDLAGFEKMEVQERAKLSRRVEDGIKDILDREQRAKFDDMMERDSRPDPRAEMRNRLDSKEGDGDHPREPREPRKKRRAKHAEESGDEKP